jgi:DNA invertase Pin-like site-specific DNA recombinase
MIAREYLRVSVDKSGRERSIDEQAAENRKAARSLGIKKFGTPYKDTGSASRHARKQRDDFRRLLNDLASGRFDADVLVLWESSRGSRKVGEWVDLIEKCEKAGVRIAVTTHNRCYSPGNARDRRTLLEDSIDAEYESGKLSARGKRAAAAAAAEGLPHGRVPYGYKRTYDPMTKRLVRQEPDPIEAPIVRELFKRLRRGESLTAIADDFTARGIKSRGSATVPPTPFCAQTLRGIALAPVYAGRRVHSPNGTHKRSSDAEHSYDGTWKALVTDETFYAVQARLRDPARITTRPGRAKHLLTMTARCDVCDGPLVATNRFDGGRRYQCNVGHVLVMADDLDAWAEGQVLSLLTRPDVVRRLMPKAVDAKAMRAARNDVARCKHEHDELVAQVAAGKLSSRLAAGAEPAILQRLEVAEQRVVALSTPAELQQLIEPGATVRQQWRRAAMSTKREIVRLLFAPGLLGVLSVAGVNGGANTIEARARLDGKPLRAKRTSKRS